ncbi:phosphogluconate dehydrogenase (NAD(+)-dependent, decarboxylating) [Hydrogenivirga sp. 128-5-R1-1]|uniref:phosphogluconate dehydrogenase (NAD(+)-dependent, decarboxylating) n=1 Tax=Hydrogenivirga sp. 128-5-R1-1 TaxID=392423 RepID=UPI00015F3840|nr:decarboxylating 6-phosphogluconate dehydrogenase [Hydrogenivirga sp. 128-5-R1-1]EDP76449.1 6-phosphogluconate dehydrogenase [Hydrogenivirga sp. 128-5-R1-1]
MSVREIGIIGLGRMGLGIGKRLVGKGWRVFGYDPSEEARERAEEGGIESFEELSFLCGEFTDRKLLWIMVPHTAVDGVISSLREELVEGDVVIDGGNSFYKDSVRRFNDLSRMGVHFLDVGVSGGVWGEEQGFCLMVGGEEKVFRELEELFIDLSYGGDGYAYMGRAGSGHFVKMVHNGIEYGMMQAIAEGFELMKESDYDLDLEEVARVYTRGSVIRSWLMELTHKSLRDFGDLKGIEPYVQDSGEGRWTVQTAVELGVPVWVISDALFNRFRSRQNDSFRDKLLAALRYEFGRHEVKKKDE